MQQACSMEFESISFEGYNQILIILIEDKTTNVELRMFFMTFYIEAHNFLHAHPSVQSDQKQLETKNTEKLYSLFF